MLISLKSAHHKNFSSLFAQIFLINTRKISSLDEIRARERAFHSVIFHVALADSSDEKNM